MIPAENLELSTPVTEQYFEESFHSQKPNHPNLNVLSRVIGYAIRKNQLILIQSCIQRHCQFQWWQSSSESALVNIFKNCDHQR